MAPTKMQEMEMKLAGLLKENSKLKETISGLEKRVAELSSKPQSKTHVQAAAGLELLKAGPVTSAQLKTINEKYPSDVVYYVRNLLKQDVKMIRKDGATIYMLPEHFKVYQEGLEKEKAQKEAAKAQPPAQAAHQPQAQA